MSNENETWLTDGNGNKCSVEYFGSREAAQATLDSLKNCQNCTNCSGCSDCSRCSGCSDCSDCSDCKNIAYLNDKIGISADPTLQLDAGAPPIPRIENIHQRIFEAISQPQALNMGCWHSCNTTHCRGGWVVTLAGEAGKKLEAFHNTELAAMLIYRESGYHINPARFYDGNEAALEDMRKLASLTNERVLAAAERLQPINADDSERTGPFTS